MEAMEKVCSMLPDKYSEKCNDFLQKYGKQVVDFLLSDAAPHTICVLLHLCLLEETPPTGQPQNCTLIPTVIQHKSGRHNNYAMSEKPH